MINSKSVKFDLRTKDNWRKTVAFESTRFESSSQMQHKHHMSTTNTRNMKFIHTKQKNRTQNQRDSINWRLTIFRGIEEKEGQIQDPRRLAATRENPSVFFLPRIKKVFLVLEKKSNFVINPLIGAFSNINQGTIYSSKHEFTYTNQSQKYINRGDLNYLRSYFSFVNWFGSAVIHRSIDAFGQSMSR